MLTVHTDGGCSGNPGPIGIGYVIEATDKDGITQKYTKYESFNFKGTNNQAEYLALLHCLQDILNNDNLNEEREISIFSDSKLMVEQIKGNYKVKNDSIKALYKYVMKLLNQFDSWKIQHVLREYNAEADALAKKGVEESKELLEVKTWN
jgi:ribonuclease HI